MLNNLGLYLFVGFVMLVLGGFVLLTRKNFIAVLMGIELILNAANINFVAFSRFRTFSLIEGHLFALVILLLAAIEAAVALAILLNLYRYTTQVEIDGIKRIQG